MTDWGVPDGGAGAAVPNPSGKTASATDRKSTWDDPDGGQVSAGVKPDNGWGRPDGGVPRQRVDLSVPDRRDVRSPLSTPPPEATASLLAQGETLWAKVDRAGVVLGSGQVLNVPEGLPDDLYGWRRVQIVNPALLTARVLPIAWDELEVGVGDDPTGLYYPHALPEPESPDRMSAFPVGAGPDLMRLFNDRVATAVSEYERRAGEAERAAGARAVEAERVADQRARTAEWRAAEVERNAREQIAEARRRAAHAEATVERRSADAARHAEQRIAAANQAIEGQLASYRQTVDNLTMMRTRYRRAIVALALALALATAFGWLFVFALAW